MQESKMIDSAEEMDGVVLAEVKQAKILNLAFNLIIILVLLVGVTLCILHPKDWVRWLLATIVGYWTVTTYSSFLKYVGVYPPRFSNLPTGDLLAFSTIPALLINPAVYAIFLAFTLNQSLKYSALLILMGSPVWDLATMRIRRRLFPLFAETQENSQRIKEAYILQQRSLIINLIWRAVIAWLVFRFL